MHSSLIMQRLLCKDILFGDYHGFWTYACAESRQTTFWLPEAQVLAIAVEHTVLIPIPIAVVYGNGVYFARDASYSAQHTYSPPDAKGYRYIYSV